MISDHTIKNYEQFSHTGGKDYFISLAVSPEPLCKVANNRIETAGCKRGHVQHTANIFSPAPDVSLAVIFTGRVIPRRSLSTGDERKKRRQLVEKALRALSTPISEQTIF